MNNTELTLDQLAAFSGGGVFAKLDGFKQVIHPNYRPRGFDIGPVTRPVFYGKELGAIFKKANYVLFCIPSCQ